MTNRTRTPGTPETGDQAFLWPLVKVKERRKGKVDREEYLNLNVKSKEEVDDRVPKES